MSPPTASTAAARSRTHTRRPPSTSIPRRISGPSRPRAVVTSAGAVALPRSIGAPPPWRRWMGRLASLPDHRLLDRLLNGRAWIGLVGFALIGIVFMQVSLLKLNSGIGQSVERAATLDRQNSQLRAAVSELGSNDRIQAEAQRLGLVVPPAGSVTFLGSHGRRIGGDAPIALATGTAVAPSPAGTGDGATAAATAATATSATTATQAQTRQQQSASGATTATTPATATTTRPQTSTTTPSTATTTTTSPPASGTAAGGATPVAPGATSQP
jgi:hypothetical protein